VALPNPFNGKEKRTPDDAIQAAHGANLAPSIVAKKIVQYEKRHPFGSTARRALSIFMFTGLQLSDAAMFGRQHITLVYN
jgi:hypothetical protein